MKLQKIATIALTIFVSLATYGQLFTPLGLGLEKGEKFSPNFQPQMHIEGNILYVCTNQGLYSKDLSRKESVWLLVGFEGVPLQDYVRKGDDILALCYDASGGFILLSHDDGKNYEDITPDVFKEQHAESENILTSLVQHPSNPNTLLVSYLPIGLYESLDFGQSWNLLTDVPSSGFIGYHPLNPEIIYESGETWFYSPYINISYDAGQTWNALTLDYPGDNCVNRITFHPTDPDKWIAGGPNTVYTSNDNGHTWDIQDFLGDGLHDVLWLYTIYDNDNSNIIYMAGRQAKTIHIMYSSDGGKTWSTPQTEAMKKSSTECVYDFKQYDDKLLLYTESDVYEISKTELLTQTVYVSDIISTGTSKNSSIYDLQGRRLNDKPSKGIFIQNGKKVVVK